MLRSQGSCFYSLWQNALSHRRSLQQFLPQLEEELKFAERGWFLGLVKLSPCCIHVWRERVLSEYGLVFPHETFMVTGLILGNAVSSLWALYFPSNPCPTRTCGTPEDRPTKWQVYGWSNDVAECCLILFSALKAHVTEWTQNTMRTILLC